MNKIEVCILQHNTGLYRMAPFLARMTQRGHELHSIDDMCDLYMKESSDKLRASLANMPHGTIKRFDTFTIAIYGASRRFLSQIRTHQHADFVSGSLQYSDYSDYIDDQAINELFVVPYELLNNAEKKRIYLRECRDAYDTYVELARDGANDAAGFVLPNGVRNVLVIQANVQEWQYMIGLRTCKRNSAETRYVMYLIWEALYNTLHGRELFSVSSTGAWCQTGTCKEGHMCCGSALPKESTPTDLIKQEFPELR